MSFDARTSPIWSIAYGRFELGRSVDAFGTGIPGNHPPHERSRLECLFGALP